MSARSTWSETIGSTLPIGFRERRLSPILCSATIRTSQPDHLRAGVPWLEVGHGEMGATTARLPRTLKIRRPRRIRTASSGFGGQGSHDHWTNSSELSRGSADQAYDIKDAEEVAKIYALYEIVKKMPVWPFDARTIGRFATTAALRSCRFCSSCSWTRAAFSTTQRRSGASSGRHAPQNGVPGTAVPSAPGAAGVRVWELTSR